MENSISNGSISRRGFVEGAGVAVASAALATAAATSARAAESAGSDASGSVEAAGSAATAGAAGAEVQETLSCDVLVVGMGASGMMAALNAADEGAQVIAIDSAAGFTATTNNRTTGAFFVESKAELAHSWHVTKQAAYDYIMEGTHYSENSLLVRNMLDCSGPAADKLIDGGVSLMYMFENIEEDPGVTMDAGGHMYMANGDDRAAEFQALYDARPNITQYWECKATELLIDENGAAYGVIADNAGVTTEIDASAIIVCGGGFLANDEMKKRYYGGTNFVCMGFPTVDGSAMQMCIDKGAQMGKNFTVSVNEMGGCNFKATPQFSWIPGTGTNQTMYLLLLGAMLVGKTGQRFVRESRIVTSMMFTGEPLVREGTYYIVLDENMMERVRTTPLLDLFTDEAKSKLAPVLQMGFQGFTCDQIDADFDAAIDEGWAYRADTIEELADYFDLPDLPAAVEQYNAIPDQGDDLLYLEPSFVNPIEQGPFYIVQYNPGSWCTLGGLRTDGYCRVLNNDCEPISGLYAAGCSADLWSVPYYLGGTAQGFSYASGYLAAQTAVADIQ